MERKEYTRFTHISVSASDIDIFSNCNIVLHTLCSGKSTACIYWYAELEWSKFKGEKYNKICTFLIDFNYLFHNYNSRTNEYIDKLSKNIGKKNSKKEELLSK